MISGRRLTWVSTARLVGDCQGDWEITGGLRTLMRRDAPPTCADWVAETFVPDGTPDGLDLRFRFGGPSATDLVRFLEMLDLHGLLRTDVFAGGRLLASRVRTGVNPQPLPTVGRLVAYTLSRFAYLRPQQAHLVLESPLSEFSIAMHGPEAVGMLDVFKADFRVDGPSVGERSEMTLALAEVLVESRFLVSRTDAEELSPWDFHDRLFHENSRYGRSALAYGRRPNAVKTETAPNTPGTSLIHLPRPERPNVVAERTLFDVLVARRSVRGADAGALDLAQLGEFLFWSAAEVAAAALPEPARTYPSAGALYPLHIYVDAIRCAGLGRGLYEYDGRSHSLRPVSVATEHSERLRQQYEHIDALATDSAAVLLLISLDYAKVASAYERVGYANALKELGTLFQNMYLVATAIGLAPCALGGGPDAHLSALPISGVVIGEFLLASRAAG